MGIQARKIAFIQSFLQIKNEDIISQLEEILNKANIEDERNLEPFSVEELNNRVNQSEIDFENGRYKTTAELLKKY